MLGAGGEGDRGSSIQRKRIKTRFGGLGVGFDDDALSRPTIGIANTWTEAMPCNFHLRALAEHVKRGVRAEGAAKAESKSKQDAGLTASSSTNGSYRGAGDSVPVPPGLGVPLALVCGTGMPSLLASCTSSS